MRRLLCALVLALLVPLLALAGPATADGHDAPGAPLAIRSVAVGFNHACAVLRNATVKCWGAGSRLGNGTTTGRGDGPGEMGSSLPVTPVGTGRHATELAVSNSSSCARLDNGQVKCWGLNFNGELGLGDTTARGDDPGEMGDALPAVDLGAGRTATAISTNGHTCAILDTGLLKCWGPNSGGGLGLGDMVTRGDNPGEMGNSLPTVDLGNGRTVTAVSVGGHTCVILDNGTVKCWGNGSSGRLGYGNTTTRGDNAGEMGDALPTVDLGNGRTATAITTGNAFTCVILDNGAVRCWGSNGSGQLGLGDTSNRGDNAGEMGDSLPTVNLGNGRTATAITSGPDHACALLDNGTVKCWGKGLTGQLGYGGTGNIGDGAGEMGDALPAVALGTGRTAIAISGGGNYTCAVLDDFSLKCWGDNPSGQLGVGDTSARGDASNEMGDNLAVTDLGSPVVPGPALGITVEAEQSSVVVGEDIDYTVTVTNTGGVPLTGVAVTDTDVPGCAGSIGSLALGASGTTTCSHTAVEAEIGTYSHTATADSDQTAAVASAPSQVTVASNATIGIEVEAEQTSVMLGEDIDYTVTVTNTGPVALTEVVITDSTVPGCAATVGDLDVGSDHEVTCSHTTTDIGTFSHAATADSEETEPVTSEPSEVTVLAPPFLQAEISGAEQVLVGEEINFTVTVFNTGGVPLTGVTITDTDVPGCAGTIGALAVEASAQTTCSHTATNADLGTFTHTVTVDSDQTEPLTSDTVEVIVARVRPDGRIRLGGGAIAGNNVYNTTGLNQGRSATVGNRGTARFTITVQNDGTTFDDLRVTGFGSSSRYLVTYKTGAEDMTAEVVDEGLVFEEVAPGGLRTVTLLVQARNGIPRGAAITRKVTVLSTRAELRDVVKATVTRR